MLYHGLKQQGIYRHQAGWGKLLVQALVGNFLMAMFLIYFTPPVQIWLNWPLLERVPYLLGFVAIAAILYALGLLASGFRPRHLQAH